MNESDDIVVHTVSFDGGVILQPVGDVDLARAPGLRRVLTEAQAKEKGLEKLALVGIAVRVVAVYRHDADTRRRPLLGPPSEDRCDVPDIGTVITDKHYQ